MIKNIVIVMMLSGCGSPQTVQLQIPDELRQCGPRVLAPLPPKVPTTPSIFWVWAKRTQTAWLKSDARGNECSDKLERLNQLLEEYQNDRLKHAGP